MGILCLATGASERTLQYAFREQFQISPKQYLIARRLDGVRRELRGGGENGVSEIANAWGFPHAGQFAACYRSVYGELPSETKAGGR